MTDVLSYFTVFFRIKLAGYIRKKCVLKYGFFEDKTNTFHIIRFTPTERVMQLIERHDSTESDKEKDAGGFIWSLVKSLSLQDHDNAISCTFYQYIRISCNDDDTSCDVVLLQSGFYHDHMEYRDSGVYDSQILDYMINVSKLCTPSVLRQLGLGLVYDS
jgi:hypothetical protein